MEHTRLIERVLITEEQLSTRVKQMGEQITKDYLGKQPLFVGILKGAWMFLADLTRYVDLNTEVDFMQVSSYFGGTESVGTITMIKDLTTSCKGKDIVLVEDIVDTGVTLDSLKTLLLERGAHSVKIATALSKSSRRQKNVVIDYIGFEIPDEFVVGYGLDFDEKYRYLRDVCVLKEEACK